MFFTHSFHWWEYWVCILRIRTKNNYWIKFIYLLILLRCINKYTHSICNKSSFSMIIVSTALDQFSLGIFTSHKSVYLWCTYTGTSMPALNNRSLSVRNRTDVVRANKDKSSKFFCSYVIKKIIFRQNSRIMYFVYTLNYHLLWFLVAKHHIVPWYNKTWESVCTNHSVRLWGIQVVDWMLVDW